MNILEEATAEGIKAAADYISSLPEGHRFWSSRELNIARIAAREALIAFHRDSNLPLPPRQPKAA